MVFKIVDRTNIFHWLLGSWSIKINFCGNYWKKGTFQPCFIMADEIRTSYSCGLNNGFCLQFQYKFKSSKRYPWRTVIILTFSFAKFVINKLYNIYLPWYMVNVLVLLCFLCSCSSILHGSETWPQTFLIGNDISVIIVPWSNRCVAANWRKISFQACFFRNLLFVGLLMPNTLCILGGWALWNLFHQLHNASEAWLAKEDLKWLDCI